MKRTVAILMVTLYLIILLSSCGNSSVDDAASERKSKWDRYETETTDTSTDSGSQDNTEYIDKTDYETLKKASDPSILLYAGNELISPTFTAYYHNYQAALSFTFDDGYDTDTARYVTSIFARYNIHGTAMISPTFLQHEDGSDNYDKINVWKEVLAKGYLDVGVHGYSHLSPSNVKTEELLHREIVESREYLKSIFPEQNILTFATPFAAITDMYERYLSQYYIANREDGGVTPNLLEDFNPYRIASVAVTNKMPASEIYTMTYRKLDLGKWCVILMHCVEDRDQARDTTNTTRKVFAEYVDMVYSQYKDKVWFASFEEVAIYKKQLENAKINYKSADKEKMVFNVTCDLDSDVYNIPMTIKINIPDFSSTAYVKIGETEQDVNVVIENGKKFVYILDCPVNGEDIEIYLAGNRTCDNGCKHYYDIVETVKASCSQRGYSLHECKICKNTYYNDFVAKYDHIFGQWVKSNDATYKERKCSECDYTERADIIYTNVAGNAGVTATPSINEYAPPSAINDDNTSTFYQSSKGSGTSIEIDLFSSKKYISVLELVLLNYQNPYENFAWVQGAEQEIEISVYKDGAWQKISTWNNNDATYDENTITISFGIYDNVSKIKIDFVKSSQGATNIYEAYIMAEVE